MDYYNIGITKTLIGVSATIISLIISSFFISNIVTSDKSKKYNFIKVASILLISYLISRLNKTIYSYRGIIIFLGHIISILLVSKDKWYKKLLYIFIVYFAIGITSDFTSILAGLKNGYTYSQINEILNLSSNSEEYYEFASTILNSYAAYALNGVVNIIEMFLFIIVILIKNRKELKQYDIFLIILFITLFGVTSSILSYFYLNDIWGTIIMIITSISTIFIMYYSYSKLNFYKVYYAQEKELEFLKEKERMQYEYYKDLYIKEEEIHKINHDIRNNLQVISNLKNKKDREKLIININNKLDENKLVNYSNNKILNVLLNLKMKEALSKNINLNIEMKYNLDFIEDIDLCNLFSNILDNAIKGVENSSTKNINLKVYNKINYIVISIINDTVKNKRVKKDKNHGYGLKIINDIVNKYNGEININNKENIFELTIMFNRENLISLTD